MSRCRTNFHSESEAMINKQINMELYASYVYLSMVSMYSKYRSLRSLMCARICSSEYLSTRYLFSFVISTQPQCYSFL